MQSDFNQRFNLRDIFYYILKRWRGIILFGLIGGILLGGFTLFKSNIMKSDSVDDVSENPKSPIETLTDDEKKEIEKNILSNDPQCMQINSKIESLKDRYLKLNDQVANSLYLSMADADQFLFEFDVKIELNSKDDENQADIDENLRELIVDYNNQFYTKNFFEYIEYQTNRLVPNAQVRDLVKTSIKSNDSIHVILTAPKEVLPSLKDAIKRYIETRADDTIVLSHGFVTKIMNEESKVDSNEDIKNELAEINEQISALSLKIDQYEIELQERLEIGRAHV